MINIYHVLGWLGVYIAILLGVGAYARTRSQDDTEEDYFVANRSFSLFVLFFTYEASLFSMWLFMGTGGYWLDHGMGFWCHTLWMTMSGLLLWWLGTRIWLCGKKWNFVTPADLLAHRYGSETVRVVVALMSAGFIFPYILLQIKGGGLLLDAASGGQISYELGAGLMMVVVVAYTIIGGARAVAWTDAIQGFVFMTIIWVIAIGAVITIGGGLEDTFVRMQELSKEHLTLPGPAGKFTGAYWLSFWFVQGIALGNAGVWMRIYSAKSPRTLRQTGALIPITGVIAYLATFLYAYAGMSSGKFFGTLESSDKLLPTMLATYWPALVLPMIVGAFAAAMSTADSQLLAASAVCTSDIYKRYIKPAANQSHLVWVGRIFVVLFTGVAFLVSLSKGATLLVSLGVFAYAGTANLAVPLIGAFFWKRATAKGAIAGSVVGSLTLLFLYPKTCPILFLLGPDAKEQLASLLGSSPLHAGFIGLMFNAIVFYVVSILTSHGPGERHEEYAEFMEQSYADEEATVEELEGADESPSGD